MTRRFTFAALLAAALLAPAAAAAQDEAPRPSSLSLAPFGGLTVGLWHRFSPRVEAGLQVGARYEALEGDDAEQEATVVELEPAVKLHARGGGALRPYTYAGLEFARGTNLRTDGGDESGITTLHAGAAVGLGLEWTPAARVRIGGHAGVAAGYREQEFRVPGQPNDHLDGWQVSTFNSGLTVYYSF